MQQATVSISATTSTATVSDIRHFYLGLCRACRLRVAERMDHGGYFASAVISHPFFGNLRLEISQNTIALTCSAPNSAMYGVFVFDGKTWKVFPPSQLNKRDRPAMDIVLQTCPEILSYLDIGTLKHDPSKLLPKDEESRPDSPYMFELVTKLILLFTRTI